MSVRIFSIPMTDDDGEMLATTILKVYDNDSVTFDAPWGKFRGHLDGPAPVGFHAVYWEHDEPDISAQDIIEAELIQAGVLQPRS